MSKHTPGPWHVDSVMSDALHDICMSNPPPGEGNPVVLATMSYDEDRGTCPTLEQANANARLIAAAPDLLAACKELLPWAECFVKQLDEASVGQLYPAIRQAALRLACNAIAKAEGVPPP